MQESKKEFIKLLGVCAGNITRTCAELGISRQCYHKWRTQDSDFAGQCDIIIGTARAQRREQKRKEEKERRAESARRRAAGKEQPAVPDIVLERGSGSVHSDTDREDRHVEELREALRGRGLYASWLEPQIRAAAKLMVSITLLGDSVAGSSAVISFTSREGDERSASNPAIESLRRSIDSLTAILKALGLNFDAKVMTPEKDGFASLMEKLNADD